MPDLGQVQALGILFAYQSHRRVSAFQYLRQRLSHDPLQGGVEVGAEEGAAHDDAHIEGADGLAAVASTVAEGGDVEAGHSVGVTPGGYDLVPWPGVELLPGHLPCRIRCTEVPCGRFLRRTHEREATLLRDPPQQRCPTLLVDQHRLRRCRRWGSVVRFASHAASVDWGSNGTVRKKAQKVLGYFF